MAKEQNAEETTPPVTTVWLAVIEADDGEHVCTVPLHRLPRGAGLPGRELPIAAVKEEYLSFLERYSIDVANKERRTVRIYRFTERQVHAKYPPSTTGD